MSRETRSPAGSGPYAVRQGPAKTALTIRHKNRLHPIRPESATNAHLTQTRKRQMPQNIPAPI